MKAKYLLDTVIIIDHLNGINDATEWILSKPDNEIVISVITRAEVLTGATKSEKSKIILFLDKYSCLRIDTFIADEAAKLRQKFRWKLPDAFQAALAITHQLKLVTCNTKNFSEENQNFVIIPYRF